MAAPKWGLSPAGRTEASGQWQAASGQWRTQTNDVRPLHPTLAALIATNEEILFLPQSRPLLKALQGRLWLGKRKRERVRRPEKRECSGPEFTCCFVYMFLALSCGANLRESGQQERDKIDGGCLACFCCLGRALVATTKVF